MVRKILLITALLMAWPAAGEALNLTGRWTSDAGGTYYIRQVGPNVYWYGERGSTMVVPWGM